MESYLVYLISRLTMGLVRRLPRLSAIRILDALASLTYLLDASHRRIARVNLTIAFPELSMREHGAIAKRSFQNTARNLLEVSHMSRLTREQIGSLVGYDPESGLNNFERARANGKGILYLTGHFSAWELLPTAHALHGHPLSFVTRPLDNAPLERYLCKVRESAGNQVIYKKNSARHILAKLKAGEDVGILMDQNTSLQEGVFADLFGLPAATSTSIALLALRTEAAVLPGYLYPKPEGRYTIKFLPPVELIRTGDTNRDISANTRRLNQILEGIIREQPDTWLWGHMRWKYQPEGTPDLYHLSPADLRAYLAQNAQYPSNDSHE
ncbi:MAG: lysophospholipid acyltransferase family protein [Acidobacteriota bacterium]